MHRGPKGTKYCHLIWVTRNGRSCFKIAEAAQFCERAVHQACATLGWKPEVVAVLPDRVHILMPVPPAENRWRVSPRLQQAVTRLLRHGGRLPGAAGPVWASTGWCSVLPSAVSAAAVRRVLRERMATHNGGNARRNDAAG
jgi:REP element-mobilizing transposase RayT